MATTPSSLGEITLQHTSVEGGLLPPCTWYTTPLNISFIVQPNLSYAPENVRTIWSSYYCSLPSILTIPFREYQYEYCVNELQYWRQASSTQQGALSLTISLHHARCTRNRRVRTITCGSALSHPGCEHARISLWTLGRNRMCVVLARWSHSISISYSEYFVDARRSPRPKCLQFPMSNRKSKHVYRIIVGV